MSEPFRMPVTPRYMEIDAQGVVFNAWYLVWWDEGMTAWMRHIGLDYPALLERGFDVQNVHAEVDYRSGVRWGEQVEVLVDVQRVGTKSFTVGYTVARASGDVCVEGHIVYAMIATDGSGALEIPSDVRALLEERLASAA